MPLARQGVESIRQRRTQGWYARLAYAAWWRLAAHNMRIHLRAMRQFQHTVLWKVFLLHHAIMNVNASIQDSCQGKYHSTFHLLSHDARVNDDAAVYSARHTVYAGQAAVY